METRHASEIIGKLEQKRWKDNRNGIVFNQSKTAAFIYQKNSSVAKKLDFPYIFNETHKFKIMNMILPETIDIKCMVFDNFEFGYNPNIIRKILEALYNFPTSKKLREIDFYIPEIALKTSVLTPILCHIKYKRELSTFIVSPIIPKNINFINNKSKVYNITTDNILTVKGST